MAAKQEKFIPYRGGGWGTGDQGSSRVLRAYLEGDPVASWTAALSPMLSVLREPVLVTFLL